MSGHEACPFCGGRRQQVRPVWGDWLFIACSCKAAGAPARTVGGAWANWDRRSEPVEELEQLELFGGEL